MKASKNIRMAMAAIVRVVLLGTLLIGHAHAEQCPLISSRVSIAEINLVSKLLKDGKFSEVDAMLVKLHQTNLISEGSDLLTLLGIEKLMSLNEVEDSLVRRWVDERPLSFFAQLSAGVFFSAQAAKARGNKFSSETDASQFKKMSEFHRVAIGHLFNAIRFGAGSALPHSVFMVIAAREGKAAGKTPTQWLLAAIQADPKTLATRVRATASLTPRWGGTFEFLDQMVQESEGSLPAQSVYFLRYSVVMQKASHEEVITKNKPLALDLYKEAQSMCENSTEARHGIERTSR